jgi:hypothetical protein
MGVTGVGDQVGFGHVLVVTLVHAIKVVHELLEQLGCDRSA